MLTRLRPSGLDLIQTWQRYPTHTSQSKFRWWWWLISYRPTKVKVGGQSSTALHCRVRTKQFWFVFIYQFVKQMTTSQLAATLVSHLVAVPRNSSHVALRTWKYGIKMGYSILVFKTLQYLFFTCGITLRSFCAITVDVNDINKQTIHIVPKSKIESRAHYAPEPE